MIDFKSVYKSYGEQVLLDDVSFRINPGERVGFVGPNGSGKSTVFGIICGEVLPDKGSVSLPKNLSVGYLRQQLPADGFALSLLDYVADAVPELSASAARLREIDHLLHEELSDKESASLLREHGELQAKFEHMGGYRLRSEAEAALCGLGFHINAFTRPLGSFSGGWQMRAGLARVLIGNPDFLLLDEPSNYLDIPAVEWLCRFLKAYKGTLLLISHDRFLLKKLTSITLEINGGVITRYPGDYDFYRREREFRTKTLEAAKRNQDKKKEQLTRTIERFKAKSSKASQAQSMMKMLDKMEDITLPDNLRFTGTILIPPPPPSGSEAVRLENIAFAYNDGELILKDVSLQIDSGDKVAIVGYNGTGKTTLLKTIAAQLTPQTGKVVLGHNIIRGYQAQEFADILPPEQTVYDVVKNAMSEKVPVNSLQSILGSFGFCGDHAYKPIKVLSGGEKIRVCFARIFVNPPNLLILDEPTTHLDIAACEALQQALIEYPGTVCLVSHDIEFVENVATTIVAMRPPGIKKYYGRYEYFQQKVSEEGYAELETENNSLEKSQNLGKERRKERARLRQELQGEKKAVEKAIAASESALERLEAEKADLIQQSLNQQVADYAALNRRLHEVQLEIDRVSAVWETAAARLEEILRINAEIHAD
ncbi:MAG: ABC-F family ATP-binding cassette domain-containing protein [Victivallaceae bacterium]